MKATKKQTGPKTKTPQKKVARARKADSRLAVPPLKTTANRKRSASVKKSSILEAVHEAASDLYSIGVFDKTTMREFDALCLPQVPEYTPKQIKAIRTKCNASQAVFARYINVTPSALQKWEIGAKKPNSVAMKLLSLVEQKGLEILL